MDAARVNVGSYVVNLSDKLGQGVFGSVYKCRHSKSEEVVAVKQSQIESDAKGTAAMNEVKYMQQAGSHPNIVQLLDFHYANNSMWIFMEYCDLGDLEKYMKSVNLDLDAKIKIMQQCARGLWFLHSRQIPIVHRDVKPGNILLKTAGSEKIVKITDFGVSKATKELSNLDLTLLCSTTAGTPGYMAPEIFLKQPYSSSVDIFSLGLVFLAMLNYEQEAGALVPMSANSKKIGMFFPIGAEMVQFFTLKKCLPELVEDSPDDSVKVKEVKTLIRKMCTYDGKERPPMNQVEEHLAELSAVISQEKYEAVSEELATTKIQLEESRMACEGLRSELERSQAQAVNFQQLYEEVNAMFTKVKSELAESRVECDELRERVDQSQQECEQLKQGVGLTGEDTSKLEFPSVAGDMGHQSLESELSMSPANQSTDKSKTSVALTTCNKGDLVLMCLDERYGHYVVLTVLPILHFLHTDSYDDLGLTAAPGAQRKLWLVAEIVEKEYCQASKKSNRFRVPLGTRFHRVRCKPWTNPLSTTSATETRQTPQSSSKTETELEAPTALGEGKS